MRRIASARASASTDRLFLGDFRGDDDVRLLGGFFALGAFFFGDFFGGVGFLKRLGGLDFLGGGGGAFGFGFLHSPFGVRVGDLDGGDVFTLGGFGVGVGDADPLVARGFGGADVAVALGLATFTLASAIALEAAS